MNKLIVAFTFIIFLTASSASAQSRRSLKDIDKELKQTKSTATALALIESIAETVPQTDEEVVVLGRLMDKYPTQGQRALAGVKDASLAKAVMKECERQINKFRADKDKDWKTLPEAQRQAKFNAMLNSYAMIGTLGSLKNRDALPFLKQYITPEYDGDLSYTASQAIGRIAPDDPAVFNELWSKNDVKHINYGAYGKSVLKEVSQKLQSGGLSSGEKDELRYKAKVELLNGSTPEEKRLLKEIAMTHPDKELRMQAGIAMEKALMFHPDPDDVEFVLEWTKDPKDPTKGFVMNYMRDHFSPRFVPVVINFIKDGDIYARSKSVGLASQHNIKEALPYIKECITKDKDSSVRGDCRMAYWKMTGEMSAEFTPEDAQDLENYLNHPRVVKINANRKDNDPGKQQYLAQKAALEKYKQTHH